MALDNFQNYFEIAAEWEIKAKAIVVTDASQTTEMGMAKVARKMLSQKRIDIENARKELKEQSLREGKAIDGIANVLKALIVPIEEYLKKQENFIEIKAEQEAEARRIEIEIRIEEERIAKEKSEAEERERIRLENENLKKEAEAKEKALQEERRKVEAEKAEAERKAKAEQDRLRKEAEAKLEEERQRIKKEQEEKAKIEREKIEKENEEKITKMKAEMEEKHKQELKEKKEAQKQSAIAWAHKFEDWLFEYFSESNPEILDDMLPDATNEWLGELSSDEMIELAGRFISKKVSQ